MRKKLTKSQIWAIPVVLGILTLAGLVSALVLENIGDKISWALLTVPVLVMGFYCFIDRSNRKKASN